SRAVNPVNQRGEAHGSKGRGASGRPRRVVALHRPPGERKAKRVGVGPRAKKAAELAAVQLRARLARGDLSVFAEVPDPARYADRSSRLTLWSSCPRRATNTGPLAFRGRVFKLDAFLAA